MDSRYGKRHEQYRRDFNRVRRRDVDVSYNSVAQQVLTASHNDLHSFSERKDAFQAPMRPAGIDRVAHSCSTQMFGRKGKGISRKRSQRGLKGARRRLTPDHCAILHRREGTLNKTIVSTTREVDPCRFP